MGDLLAHNIHKNLSGKIYGQIVQWKMTLEEVHIFPEY